jgi:hypothetical protein
MRKSLYLVAALCATLVVFAALLAAPLGAQYYDQYGCYNQQDSGPEGPLWSCNEFFSGYYRDIGGGILVPISCYGVECGCPNGSSDCTNSWTIHAGNTTLSGFCDYSHCSSSCNCN